MATATTPVEAAPTVSESTYTLQAGEQPWFTARDFFGRAFAGGAVGAGLCFLGAPFSELSVPAGAATGAAVGGVSYALEALWNAAWDASTLNWNYGGTQAVTDAYDGFTQAAGNFANFVTEVGSAAVEGMTVVTGSIGSYLCGYVGTIGISSPFYAPPVSPVSILAPKALKTPTALATPGSSVSTSLYPPDYSASILDVR